MVNKIRKYVRERGCMCQSSSIEVNYFLVISLFLFVLLLGWTALEKVL